MQAGGTRAGHEGASLSHMKLQSLNPHSHKVHSLCNEPHGSASRQENGLADLDFLQCSTECVQKTCSWRVTLCNFERPHQLMHCLEALLQPTTYIAPFARRLELTCRGHHRRCRRETRLRKRREGADLSSQGCFGRPSTLFEEPGDKEVE